MTIIDEFGEYDHFVTVILVSVILVVPVNLVMKRSFKSWTNGKIGNKTVIQARDNGHFIWLSVISQQLGFLEKFQSKLEIFHSNLEKFHSKLEKFHNKLEKFHSTYLLWNDRSPFYLLTIISVEITVILVYDNGYFGNYSYGTFGPHRTRT